MAPSIRPDSDRAKSGPAPAPGFVHLKVHSAYSLLEGAITTARLAKLAVAQGIPAVGLTDTNNLFGALEFSDKLAESGVQPRPELPSASSQMRGPQCGHAMFCA